MRRSLGVSGLVLVDLMVVASSASAQSVASTRLPQIEIDAPHRRQDKNVRRKPAAAQERGSRRAASRNPAPANSAAAKPNAEPSAEGAVASAPAAAASEKTVSGEEVNARPFSRPAEALEVVPGLIVTQHSGEGKANQYFLRGYYLDLGTDLAITVDDMPVNMRSHAHGQGYADLNFLIPELIKSVNIRKGPFIADEGDFSSVGAVHIGLLDTIEKTMALMTVGSFGYNRVLGITSTKAGEGHLLVAGEANTYNGPWDYPDKVRKLNAVARYSQGVTSDGFYLTGMAYSNRWNSADQVPLRAISSGLIGLYGALDPSDGGNSDRFSLSGRWAKSDENGASKVSFYVIKSSLDLYNNFTFFRDNPNQGDQFHQHDNRVLGGINASHIFKSTFAGLPMETEIGLQSRYDDIRLTLSNTYQRQLLSETRDDEVKEASVGIYI